MYVYLQPFAAKGLIDEVNAQLHSFGERPLSLPDNLSLRTRYGIAAMTGLTQAVSYFALWVFTSLSCFATLALVKPLDRWSDETGSLTVASLMATVMAFSSMFYLNAATAMTKIIVARVDEGFQQMVEKFDKDLEVDAEVMRSQRKSSAAGREEPYHPEVYFDPAVKRMLAARRSLQIECCQSYPSEVNAKGAAVSNTKARLQAVAVEQACKLRSTPCSQKEIDKHLVQKIAIVAEDSLADLYRFVIETWGLRIRQWGQKFEREAFCRNCVELFRSMKVIKNVGRFVRDVKEADDKDKAFKDSKQKLRKYLADVKARVDAINRPWYGIRLWRRLYSNPKVSSYALAQDLDRYIDPHIAHFSENSQI